MLSYLIFSVVFAYRPTIPGNIDLSPVQPPPTDLMPMVCGNYRGGNDGEALFACSSGVSSARYMAERFARDEGNLLGCMDGMQQGMNEGYMETSEPKASDIQDAQNRYQAVTMTSAVRRAQEAAHSQGSSLAESEIVKRFRSVVGTGKAPDSSYTYPTHNFRGYRDGYSHDSRIGDASGIPKEWWEKSPSAVEKYETFSVYDLHRSRYTPAEICKGNSYVMFEENMHRVNLWEYFRARGRYDFKRYGWNDSDRSWNYFRNSLNDAEIKFQYNSLKGKTVQVVEKIKVREGVAKKNPDGTDMKNALGETIWEIAPLYEDKIVDRPVAGRGVEYYQNIYRDAFIQAYRDYYMAVYFRNAFRDSFNSSTKIGELIGREIGQNVARRRADELAYNAKYEKDSIAAFNMEWKTNYDTQWTSYWNAYATRPQVDILDVTVKGDYPNGIFQAGEGLMLSANLVNIGMAADAAHISLQGDVTAVQQHGVAIPASSKLGVQTGVIAKIGDLKPHQKARLGVSIASTMGAYSGAMRDYLDTYVLVNEVAEIKDQRVQVQVNPLRGTGFLVFQTVNPSNEETLASIDLVATAEGKVIGQEVVGKLPGGSQKEVSVPFAGYDPMYVIERGLSGTVRTVMDGRTLHEVQWSRSFSDRRQLLADYFLDLITAPDQANPGASTVNDRIAQISQMILSQTSEAIRADVNWSDSGQTNSTLLGSVVISYSAAKASGRISPNIQERFHSLARELEALSSQYGTWDSVSGKKKAYRKVLNRMSDQIKVKKKK